MAKTPEFRGESLAELGDFSAVVQKVVRKLSAIPGDSRGLLCIGVLICRFIGAEFDIETKLLSRLFNNHAPASQVDYDRWRSVWVFLSSGMVSKCTTELWLDFLSDGQSFEWIAERLEAWFPRPEFKQEFRLVHHDLISQFEHKHGPAAVFELTAWKDYVFIHGGSDRASEAFWSSICYKRYHSSRRRSSGLIGKGETSSIVEDLGSDLVISGRILDEKFRNIPSASEQIFICSADTLSGFDQESLRATVRVISSCNLFCVAWAQRMSSVSPEFLSSLLTSETENFQVKFGIGTDSSMLGFPGDWPALCFLRRRGYLGGQSKITG